jgi:hypothetical protein
MLELRDFFAADGTSARMESLPGPWCGLKSEAVLRFDSEVWTAFRFLDRSGCCSIGNDLVTLPRPSVHKAESARAVFFGYSQIRCVWLDSFIAPGIPISFIVP